MKYNSPVSLTTNRPTLLIVSGIERVVLRKPTRKTALRLVRVIPALKIECVTEDQIFLF